MFVFAFSAFFVLLVLYYLGLASSPQK